MTQQSVRPEGTIPSRVMIVGEAPGYEEERVGTPFVGTSGVELSKMLHEAGIIRSECFLTYVVRFRCDPETLVAKTKKEISSEHVQLFDSHVKSCVAAGLTLLNKEIEAVKPHVIIALGNLAMLALTGELGVMKWRGSELPHPSGAVVIPTYHPSAIVRQWELRAMMVQDLRRAKRVMESGSLIPKWDFIIRPNLPTAVMQLKELIQEADNENSQWDKWLDFDLETKAAHITCAGISWSRTRGICIPFTVAGKPEGYWEEAEEATVVFLLYKLLTHPKVKVRGQNLLYDAQYTYRHWHFIPNVRQDTMISHHTCFAGMKKSLAFQASMYCEYYRYWKEDHMPGGFKSGD